MVWTKHNSFSFLLVFRKTVVPTILSELRLIQRKIYWGVSKKKRNLLLQEIKREKNVTQIVLEGPKWTQNF